MHIFTLPLSPIHVMCATKGRFDMRALGMACMTGIFKQRQAPLIAQSPSARHTNKQHGWPKNYNIFLIWCFIHQCDGQCTRTKRNETAILGRSERERGPPLNQGNIIGNAWLPSKFSWEKQWHLNFCRIQIRNVRFKNSSGFYCMRMRLDLWNTTQ